MDHVVFFFEHLPYRRCLQLYVDLLDRVLAVHEQGGLRKTVRLLLKLADLLAPVMICLEMVHSQRILTRDWPR